MQSGIRHATFGDTLSEAIGRTSGDASRHLTDRPQNVESRRELPAMPVAADLAANPAVANPVVVKNEAAQGAPHTDQAADTVANSTVDTAPVSGPRPTDSDQQQTSVLSTTVPGTVPAKVVDARHPSKVAGTDEAAAGVGDEDAKVSGEAAVPVRPASADSGEPVKGTGEPVKGTGEHDRDIEEVAAEPTSNAGALRAAIPFAPADVAALVPAALPKTVQDSGTTAVDSLPAEMEMPPVGKAEVVAPDPAVQLRIRVADQSILTPPVAEVPVLTDARDSVRPTPEETPRIGRDKGVHEKHEMPPQTAKPDGAARQESGSATGGNDARGGETGQGAARPSPERASATQAGEAPFTTAVPVRHADVAPQLRTRDAVPAAPVYRDTEHPETQARTPLRSMSFEFAQDGGVDVRLKLSERAGEVHVSLHSNDAVLNHQLREGIHDLASVLTEAGYDAEPWNGQGREQGRDQREEARQNQASGEEGTAAFNSLLNNYPNEYLQEVR